MTHALTHLVTPIAITRLATSAALVGALWSTLLGKRCQTCQMASGMSAGLPLARIGSAFYVLVLSATFLPHIAPAAWALSAAAGAHLVLASILFRSRVMCGNCLLTAAAALIAAAAAIAAGPAINLLALLAAPLGSLLILFAIGIAATAANRRSTEKAERLLAEVARDLPPVAAGKVKMIVLAKPDCWACQYLKSEVMPELEREFAGIMEVEFRPAGEGTPAPTLLIFGKTSVPFIGAAPAEAISPSIRLAMGQPAPAAEATMMVAAA